MFCFLLGARIGEAANPGPDRMRSAAQLLITDRLAKEHQGKNFEQAFKDKVFSQKIIKRLASGASKNTQALYHSFKAKVSKQKLDAYINEPGQAAGSENANTTGNEDTGDCTRSRTCTDLAIIQTATQATPVRRARRASPPPTAAPPTMLDNIPPYIGVPTILAAADTFYRRYRNVCCCLAVLIILAPHLCGVTLGTGFEFIYLRL